VTLTVCRRGNGGKGNEYKVFPFLATWMFAEINIVCNIEYLIRTQASVKWKNDQTLEVTREVRGKRLLRIGFSLTIQIRCHNECEDIG